MAEVNPGTSLEFVAKEVDQLSRLLADLTDDQWQRSSICAGWKVADIAAHVVRNGESVLFAALSGAFGASPELELVHYGPSSRPRDAEIMALGPRAGADLQRSEAGAFVGILSHMTADQLNRPARHPSGVRPVGWFAHNRLSELAFHHWDIRTSLGQRGCLDNALAEHLLSFMLDPQQPIPSNLRSKDLAEQRILFKTPSGPAWLLTTSSKGLNVQPASAGSPDITVEADAGWLALALYGRARISEPAFKVSGAPNAAGYFATAFGEPSNMAA
jgi:uncharacterized protein (TIGR03083 family)